MPCDAMPGEHGVLKADLSSKFYTHVASSVRMLPASCNG
jgi:hypothetical protein